MSWCDEFLHIARWALMSEDLRHRYIFAASAGDLPTTPGIAKALETTAVLALYQAALGKGYIARSTVDHERRYPGIENQNPPRADLAFKDEGPGQNWAYVEVKQYKMTGYADVARDVNKLKRITQRTQRWLFVYRVRREDTHARNLADLLKDNFGSALSVYDSQMFPSVPNDHVEEGVCEMCLARVY